MASQMAAATLSVLHHVGSLLDLLASCFRLVGSPRLLRLEAPPQKMLKRMGLDITGAFAWAETLWLVPSAFRRREWSRRGCNE